MDKNFVPGSIIYAVARNRDKSPHSVYDFVFLNKVDDCAMLCDRTTLEDCMDIVIYSIGDCYATKEEAEAAFNKEMEQYNETNK